MRWNWTSIGLASSAEKPRWPARPNSIRTRSAPSCASIAHSNAGEWTLHISFRGILNDKLHGFYRSQYQDASGKTHTVGDDAIRIHRCAPRVPMLGRARTEGELQGHAGHRSESHGDFQCACGERETQQHQRQEGGRVCRNHGDVYLSGRVHRGRIRCDRARRCWARHCESFTCPARATSATSPKRSALSR